MQRWGGGQLTPGIALGLLLLGLMFIASACHLSVRQNELPLLLDHWRLSKWDPLDCHDDHWVQTCLTCQAS